ncbi:hypothetical protein FXB78_01280 [Aggregatibacter actinomycetemcomitans]|uniref:hypothetical protein n=1 Tax=Aggregatibacter actinomycetemcomitans TaxID=714 RepID=UPI0011D92F92|nr:hypothetical protein [Aggregatibacter actinomycetemcomitans]QEH44474.1 hypothetical protein FXN58_01825 [Aggregatibacter actinomycetemcomitans]QEH46906.1 hypothetical protein FXN59_04010 [Aggregatibacter actinomycetemcomitans]QEH48548.1 hypothetical protein FXN57_01860 [Aggregatibacter actinomycetemcomitans]TYA48486.1 hypothetical protein FXB74_09820 [Aggregatibacter actinomycetemcomitans]TYA51923.1 hypothetical protein FXB81_01290 [Aggregatibacter actinomycetemcomitans]
MKKKIHSVLFLLTYFFSIQGQTMQNIEHTGQNRSNQSIQDVKQQLAAALARQEQKQIIVLQKKLTSLSSLSPQRLAQQIRITEKILTRIFKTEKNLTPKFIDYLYFEPIETTDDTLIQEMTKNLLISFLANERAQIYIKDMPNANQFVQLLTEKGAKTAQISVLAEPAKTIFRRIREQMYQDFPNKKQFTITENRVSVIAPSSVIKPRLALAAAIFDQQFKGVEVDDFSYLDQPRENLQHNNDTTRYKTFQAMLEGLE